LIDEWSYGRIASAIGKVVDPARPALIHGDHVTTWGEFDQRTDALASAFLSAGAVPGDKVAHLMRNSPAYLETTYAAFKARLKAKSAEEMSSTYPALNGRDGRRAAMGRTAIRPVSTSPIAQTRA